MARFRNRFRNPPQTELYQLLSRTRDCGTSRHRPSTNLPGIFKHLDCRAAPFRYGLTGDTVMAQFVTLQYAAYARDQEGPDSLD